jgi:CheY-like chemotaxis protein
MPYARSAPHLETRSDVPDFSGDYPESVELAMRSASMLPPARRPDCAVDCQTPILVADDDADDLFFIERLIKKTGVKNPIKTFNDGSEIVNYLGARLASSDPSHHRPALLFLDLRMAGLGGFGFLEWAREQKRILPLTMVVLSNSSQPADMAQALALGAHRYLVKYPCVQTMTTIVRSVYPFTLA